MNDSKPRLPADELTPGVSGDGPLDEAIAEFAAAGYRIVEIIHNCISIWSDHEAL